MHQLLGLHPPHHPQPGPHAHQQLLEGERLREVVVGAALEAQHLICHLVARGEQHHRHPVALRADASASTSSPSMSGRPRSRTTRSGAPLRTAMSAEDPSPTTSTEWPAARRPRSTSARCAPRPPPPATGSSHLLHHPGGRRGEPHDESRTRASRGAARAPAGRRALRRWRRRSRAPDPSPSGESTPALAAANLLASQRHTHPSPPPTAPPPRPKRHAHHHRAPAREARRVSHQFSAT